MECKNILQGHSAHIKALTVIPDKKILVSGSDDKTIKLWNYDRDSTIALDGHSNSIQTLAYICSEHVVISGSEDKTIRLWNPVNGECVMSIQGHSNTVMCIIVIE